MTIVLTAAALFVLGAALVVALAVWRDRRWRALMAGPFPPDWRRILERRVPLCGALPAELRPRMLGLVRVFMASKNFEGCDGLELTDEIRLTIAAQACLLLVGRPGPAGGGLYPRLYSILVYPAEFMAPDSEEIGSMQVMGEEARLGESWGGGGVVVLSWNDVRHGVVEREDGYNVVLHEFAHQLDQADGDADGFPPLAGEAGRQWRRILGREFEEMREAVRAQRRTFMDEYGAESPAEFFAVATEVFFERARGMKLRHPALYEALKAFYGLDPAQWR